jgi:hypothetical protein
MLPAKLGLLPELDVTGCDAVSAVLLPAPPPGFPPPFVKCCSAHGVLDMVQPDPGSNRSPADAGAVIATANSGAIMIASFILQFLSMVVDFVFVIPFGTHDPWNR